MFLLCFCFATLLSRTYAIPAVRTRARTYIRSIRSSYATQGIRGVPGSDQFEVLRWEKYNETYEHLSTFTEGIHACTKVFASENRLLFSPEAELTHVEGLFGGIPPAQELTLEHVRPICSNPSNCEMNLREVGQAALNALRGKTLLMAGDSTVRQNYLALVCMLALSDSPNLISAAKRGEALRQYLHEARGKECPARNSTWCVGFPRYSAKVTYQWMETASAVNRMTGVTSLFSQSKEELADHAFPKVLEGFNLDGNDILLLNLGLGYDRYFTGLSRLDDPTEVSSASSMFEEEVRNTMLKVMQPSLYRDGQHPKLVWRETVPQHFNTSQGFYISDNEEGFQMFNTSQGFEYVSRKICAPLAPLAIRHGANVRNEIANAVMGQLKIPVIPVWQALSVSEQLHVGFGDCTHFKLDANLWMSFQEAKFIAQRLV